MDWVVISTGMFTSYLFEPEFGVIDLPGRKVNALGTASNAVTLTTPEDIGAMTAQIVFHSPPFETRSSILRETRSVMSSCPPSLRKSSVFLSS